MSNFLKDGAVTLPSNNVTRAELRAWVFALQPDDGTATAAMEGVSAAGFLQLTSATAGAKTMTSVTAIGSITTPAALNQAMQDSETLTASIFVVSVSTRNTVLAHSAAATGTLAAGTYVNQEKHIVLSGSGSGYTVTITLTGGGFTTLTFGEVSSGQIADEVYLKWDGAAWNLTNNISVS